MAMDRTEMLVQELHSLTEALRRQADSLASRAMDRASETARNIPAMASDTASGAARDAYGQVSGMLERAVDALKDAANSLAQSAANAMTGGGTLQQGISEVSMVSGMAGQRHANVRDAMAEMADLRAQAGLSFGREEAEAYQQRLSQREILRTQNRRMAMGVSGAAPEGLFDALSGMQDDAQAWLYRTMGRERQARQLEMNGLTEGR